MFQTAVHVFVLPPRMPAWILQDAGLRRQGLPVLHQLHAVRH